MSRSPLPRTEYVPCGDITGEASGDKQFITVVTKSGNYFYIIIDRAEDGENTVHFLNQVDEADLTALMEDGQTEAPVCSCTEKCVAGSVNTDCPVCSVSMSECAGKEAEPEPEETEQPPEEEKGGGKMRSELAVGDEITTIGGVVGTICQVKEDTIIIETSATVCVWSSPSGPSPPRHPVHGERSCGHQGFQGQEVIVNALPA